MFKFLRRKAESDPIYTPAQFEEVMRRLWEKSMQDGVAAHEEADDAIANLLCSIGYKKGIHYYNLMERWYE